MPDRDSRDRGWTIAGWIALTLVTAVPALIYLVDALAVAPTVRCTSNTELTGQVFGVGAVSFALGVGLSLLILARTPRGHRARGLPIIALCLAPGMIVIGALPFFLLFGPECFTPQ